jgi:hypothetical protein
MRLLLAHLLLAGLVVACAGAQTAPIAIDSLIAANPADRAERLAYIAECRKALQQTSSTPLEAQLCKRIGDVYLSLEDPAQMERWYGRAIAIDPSLRTTTSIGYQLRERSKVRLGRRGASISLAAFVALCSLVLFRGIRNRMTFDRGLFVRRCTFFVLLYGAVAALVLALDAGSASRWLLGLSAAETGAREMVPPVIPLSMIDGSQPGTAALLLLCGLLPILLAAFGAAFERGRSKALLGCVVIVAAASLWAHLYFARVFGPAHQGRAFIRSGRVYVQGEPEELLLRDPHRALRANPDLLRSGNVDLEEFIKEHYPNGLR